MKILRANPAGNITLFVLDSVERDQRAHTAARLMAIPELGAEQVGFLCPPILGGDARIEMMGGEFCGNAARAFGLLTARNLGGLSQVRIEISGCDHPVLVAADLAAGAARSEMPLPREIRRETVAGHRGTLVHLGGIAHLVVEDAAPSQTFFAQAEPLFQTVRGLDAYGVIFLDREGGKITPLVKVPATNTLVWEGSCGSGTLAAAVAQSWDNPKGTFIQDYIQPAGMIQAVIVWENRQIMAAYIGGPVSLDLPIEIEL